MTAPAVIRIARRIAPVAGGLEQHVRALAEAQSTLGLRNHVVYGCGAPPDDPRAGYTRCPDLSRVPGDLPRGAAHSLLAYASARRLQGARVVHTHGTVGDALAAVALRRRGLRAFHSFHGGLAPRAHVDAAMRIVLPRLDGLFVVSEGIARQLAALDVALPPVHVLSSAVSDVYFDAPRGPAPRGLAMVGRLAPVKGFDLGLRAAALAVRRGVVDLVEIAGDGPDRARLEALAASLGVPVRFHGRLAPPAIAELLGRSAALLVPSRRLEGQAEGSPTVVLEAWAVGVPVVAASTGGLPYMVRHGVDGLLVDGDDPGDYARALAQAVDGAAALSAAGRERTRGWSWIELARRVAEVYALD